MRCTNLAVLSLTVRLLSLLNTYFLSFHRLEPKLLADLLCPFHGHSLSAYPIILYSIPVFALPQHWSIRSIHKQRIRTRPSTTLFLVSAETPARIASKALYFPIVLTGKHESHSRLQLRSSATASQSILTFAATEASPP